MNYEIIRFLFIGILNTIVGYFVFSIIYLVSNSEIISLFLAYIFGILFNFKTYSKYVFRSSDKQIFINFIMVYVGVFLANSLLLKLFINTLMINAYLSQIMSIIIVTPILYLLQKKYVFIGSKEFVK